MGACHHESMMKNDRPGHCTLTVPSDRPSWLVHSSVGRLFVTNARNITNQPLILCLLVHLVSRLSERGAGHNYYQEHSMIWRASYYTTVLYTTFIMTFRGFSLSSHVYTYHTAVAFGNTLCNCEYHYKGRHLGKRLQHKP